MKRKLRKLSKESLIARQHARREVQRIKKLQHIRSRLKRFFKRDPKTKADHPVIAELNTAILDECLKSLVSAGYVCFQTPDPDLSNHLKNTPEKPTT